MPKARSDDGASRHPRVLVVEPDYLVRDFVTAALEELGLQAVSAGDAAEARAHLRRSAIDLALVAVMLPRIGGEKLGAYIARRGIPVVLMSGHDEGLRRGRASGFPVLKKPFRLQDLMRMITLNLPSWQGPPDGEWIF